MDIKLEAFWTDRYVIKDRCWLWVGAKNSRGYGHCLRGGKHKLVHRISYELSVGQIPAGMTIDHICRNITCINPDHLRVMTQKENNLIGNSPTAINKRKRVCVNGHPLFGDHIVINYRKDGVRRRCKLCAHINYLRKKERLK